MARIDSLSILLQEGSGKDKLAELYGQVIETVQKATLSQAFKNKNLSGDPKSGTVEAKRFANSEVKSYGTARGAGKGDYIKDKPVTIAINVDKEIVTEVEEKDVSLLGVDGLLEARARNHTSSMVRDLERAFFTEASTGAGITYSEDPAVTVAENIEGLILDLETVKNAFVDGVDRNIMTLVLSPATYSAMRNYLDTTVGNANVDTAAENFSMFHGVKTYSSHYLPADVKAIVFVDGAVAQPVRSKGYDFEKIPLSDAFALELYYSYGTKAVTPDLIAVWKNA